MNTQEFVDNSVIYARIAVAAGHATTSDVMKFVREMHAHAESSDNLDLVETAARAGASSGRKSLLWAREVQRHIEADAESEKKRLEKMKKAEAARAKGRKPAETAVTPAPAD